MTLQLSVHRVMFLKFPFAVLQIGKEKLVSSIIYSTTGLSLILIVCYVAENFFWQKPTMMSTYRDINKYRHGSRDFPTVVMGSRNLDPIFMYTSVRAATLRTCVPGRTSRWAYRTRWQSWRAPCATSWSSSASWLSSLRCPSIMSPTSGSSCLRLPNSAQQLCNAMSPMHAHFRCSLIRTQHIMTRVCLEHIIFGLGS